MSDNWSEIPIRTLRGKGVSRETADSVLSEAEATWTKMGLTKRQIAFGMGLMDIESGFNATIWSPSRRYYGLGQFYAPTWETAVGMYNKRYHTHLSTSFTSDANIQIAVLGNWIQEILWPRAGHLFSDTSLNSHYSLEDVAYALHNRGYNWGVKAGGVEAVKDYLDRYYKRPEPKQHREKDDYEWMNEEVLPSAHRILGIPDVPPSGQRPPAATPQAPLNKPPVPAGPPRPHSSLEAPQSPVYSTSFHVDAQAPTEPMAQENKFFSYDPSQGFPMPPANPLAHYAGRKFSSPFPSPAENTTIQGLDELLRTSPPSLDFFSSGLRQTDQAIAQHPTQREGTGQVPVSQARKAPFYSLQDRLDFLGRVYRVAKPVSEATGLSLPFILAHAAHEVDFGKNIEGNNLFNLKADKDWEGPTHTRADETYRSYPSYEESMNDYLALLRGNPRYAKMLEPVTRGSLGMLADAIHHAGYSDDPLLSFPLFPFVEGVAPTALPVEGATRAPFIAPRRCQGPHHEAGPVAVSALAALRGHELAEWAHCKR
jgi:hypothetical protein